MLSIKNRLVTPTEFYQVKKFGKKISSSLFNIVYFLDTKSSESKFAFVISKKLLPKASDRNKAKRLSRALTRESLEVFPKGIKAIIFPKPQIIKSNFTELTHNYKMLVAKIEK